MKRFAKPSAVGQTKKFGNRKVHLDGITFDSVKEARRYGELKLRECAGEITDLRCHEKYRLEVNGKLVCTWAPDFVYRQLKPQPIDTVVEDAKSPATRTDKTYRVKVKLFAAVTGLQVTEV
jgi:hypothetical protein